MILIAVCPSLDGNFLSTSDGRTLVTSESVLGLMQCLPGPAVLAHEPTFYRHDHDQLAVLRQPRMRLGHRTLEVPPAELAVLSEAAGRGAEPDGPVRLYGALSVGAAAIDPSVASKFDKHIVRAALGIAHEAALAGAVASGAVRAAAVLGPIGRLAPEHQMALGNGSGYSESLLDAVWRAANAASSRDSFEWFLTLTDAPARSQLARTVRDWYNGPNGLLDGGSVRDRVTLTEYRRALRWAFSRIKTDRQR